MNVLRALAVLFSSLLPLAATQADTEASDMTAPALECIELRCEYRTSPLGIDEAKPRLGWQIASELRGQKQTAYRILVASTEEKLAAEMGDLWDTGKVQSSETIQIEYEGTPLKSGQACFWKVKSWGHDDEASAWSEPGTWTMGLLDESEWTAEYISFRDASPVFKDRESLFLPPAAQYRKEFSADKAIQRATVYATGLGIFDLELNGQPVSEEYFAPGWTDYRQRAYYKTYDVTQLLNQGDNAFGATVADGWYSGYVGFGLLTGIGTEKIGRYTYGKTPSVMLQMEIQYADGSSQRVVTDNSWKVTTDGPIQQADLLMGEFHDARKEQTGWSTVGFDDSSWQPAILAADNGAQPATFYQFENPEAGGSVQVKGKPVDLGFQRPRLESFPGLPVVVTEEIKPVSVTKRGEGTYIFDLGQNFAGLIRLKVKGESGHEIKIRYAEMLHTDGRMMTENLRKARATDFYVCKGDRDGETWSPRFTFHGFQFVEVSNFPGEPDLDTVTGLVMHSDTPMTSDFECSDEMVNRLFQNVLWTQRANFIDLPTDCPQRDERMGWTGDAQAYVATAAYNADIGAFFTKWNRELMESQRPSGVFPGYAPYPFQHGWDFGSAWADAGVICPWSIWQAYGDTRMIDRCWEPMTRFMQWRDRTSEGDLGISHGNAWGDWLAQGAQTPLEYVDTVYYAISANMMAEMAAATGRDEEAKQYAAQFQRTKKAFIRKYVRADGLINVPTQTAQALALYANLVPDELRAATGEHLKEMLNQNGNHMATGFLGTRPLLPVLSSVGQNDLAVFLMQSHEFPSWGYEIDQGATSIWERWDSFTLEDGFGRHNAAMNSFSHYSFGAVCEWMFGTLAGIKTDGPGYKSITIHPHPPRPNSNAMHTAIDWVSARYDSIRGPIKSQWRLVDGQLQLNVTIPANTTATVHVGTSDVNTITESGKPLDGHPHVEVLRAEDDQTLLRVASGSYQFTAESSARPSPTALQTSAPVDMSQNPENIDLTDARRVAHWDFQNAADVAKWSHRSSVDVQQKDGKTFLVADGDDSQIATRFESTLKGDLVVELRAMPVKSVGSQFFWAAADKSFNGRAQTKRSLMASEQVNAYLFSINGAAGVANLRFDPFDTYDKYANKGRMEIESISIYRLPSGEGASTASE